MNLERPGAEVHLDRERERLFAKATAELAADLKTKNAYSDEQNLRAAELSLDKRWSVALRHYKSIVASLSIPPKPSYEHDSEAHTARVESVLESNANRLSGLWPELRELFRSGLSIGREPAGVGNLSEETAEELVSFVAKSQGYR
jgi:hypothetical protein